MPLHRDVRLDRRRRLLREAVDVEASEAVVTPPGVRRGTGNNKPESGGTRRSAGYSQDVRVACGQRLVQLIPVRRRSLAATMFVGLLLPALLLLVHYMVYVSEQWPWRGHPLALSLDASHPQSLAAWFSSHVWLLCLGTTVLTFQLRRHKLDDYRGEYRLWFWLVITCLFGSLDSTTRVSDLFAASIDGWCRSSLGWSGPAVLRSIVVVLVGLLGLRLCSELKVVPLSLCLWLVGLVAWVASAALARDELKLDLSIQYRIWLRCGLWLTGLTAIWLAGLCYLRYVYIEAQRRFLLRGRLASTAAAIPLAERMRDAWQTLPSLPRLKRSAGGGEVTEATNDRQQRRTRRSADAEPTAAFTNHEPQSVDRHQRPIKRGWNWLRPPKDEDEAVEYAKLVRLHRDEEEPAPEPRSPLAARHFHQVESAVAAGDTGEGEDAQQKPSKRGWLPTIRAPKLGKAPKIASPRVPLPKKSTPRIGIPRIKLPKLGLPSIKLPKLGLPKLNLTGLRLKPPEESDEATLQSTISTSPRAPQSVSGMQPVDARRPLPGTAKPTIQVPSGGRGAVAQQAETGEEDDFPQAMSRAERKRLRRQQQQQNRAA